MGHEHHFLSRLDRVSAGHCELALELYRDHELLRFLLSGAELPENADRVAISLADPKQGPFLVVTREGRFVTCLGEGMRPGELPILTRVQLDGAVLRFAASRAKHEERMRIRAAEGGSRALFKRVFTAGDELTAEDVQALSAFQPLLAARLLQTYAELASDVVRGWPRVLNLLKRTERPRPHTYPALRAYWQGLWAIGHLAVLGSMGGSQVFEHRPDTPEHTCRAITLGTQIHGIFRIGQMGLWSIAKLGKSVLPTYKQVYDTAKDHTTMLEAALAMAVLGLRHRRLEAEVRKAVSPSPPKDHPELADYAAVLSFNVRRVLDEPEGLTAIQRRVGADAVVRIARQLAPGSAFRFERAEDVPEELALRFAVQNNDSFIHDESRLKYLFMCLPWLARTSAENLYLPAAIIQATRVPWRPEHTIGLMQPWVESERARAAVRPEGPSRQGPCPCGSGKKYKRCCEKAACSS
jgi:hypothetical protein